MNEMVRSDMPEQQIIRMMNLISRLFGPVGDMQFAIPLFGFDVPVETNKKYYDERVKFTYYGDTSNIKDHGGILVIATFIDEQEGVIYYGTAFCSPKDEYDKHVGKELAFNDLVENMTVTGLIRKKHHDVNSRVLADIWASGTYPSWAEDGISIAMMDHLRSS